MVNEYGICLWIRYNPSMKTSLIEIPYQFHHLRGIGVGIQESDHLVLMLHGFERNASAEPKFKMAADELASKNISSLRLDYSACGLSDGDFLPTSVETMAAEVKKTIEFLRTTYDIQKISVLAHSVSGCVVAKLIEEKSDVLQKIVLICPALNQKELQKFWYVKGKNKDKNITWSNYLEFFNEAEYLAENTKTQKMTKNHFISNDYFMASKDKDYTGSLERRKSDILVIKGEVDDRVPLESYSELDSQTLTVQKGDHDLERPDMVEQWKEVVTVFLAAD